MRQPVLVVMNVPEGTDLDKLGEDVAGVLRNADRRAWGVEWAVPVQRTDEVPAGMVSRAA